MGATHRQLNAVPTINTAPADEAVVKRVPLVITHRAEAAPLEQPVLNAPKALPAMEAVPL